MKITEVRTIALSGATHDHGWPGGTDPDEQKNTLLEVEDRRGHHRDRELLYEPGTGGGVSRSFSTRC